LQCKVPNVLEAQAGSSFREGTVLNPSDGKEGKRAHITLLTVGALYFIPITVGLRLEGFGPMYLLMLGLAAVAISKVVHLREAVTDTDTYPPQLVLVDLIIILALLIMFHLLVRPFSLGTGHWGAGTPSELVEPDTSEAAFVSGAKVFWGLIILLFAVLIPLWTWVSWHYQGLRRHHLWSYILGWTIGSVLSGFMLHAAFSLPASELIRRYKVAGWVSLVSLIFLAFEILQGSKFARNANLRIPDHKVHRPRRVRRA
jgi:hypothetical protein